MTACTRAQADHVCRACKWWSDTSADTNHSECIDAFQCGHPKLRASGVFYPTGEPVRIYTHHDFGCNQWQRKDLP